MKLGWLARSLPEFLFGGTDKFEDLDEAARRRIRAAQIGVVTQLVALTMSVNILNAGVIVYVFWDTGSNVFLTVWAGLIAAVAAAFWSWRRTRRNPPKGASLRGIKRTIIHAAVLGSIWGSAPFVLFPGFDTMHQLFLSATIAGMISGGAFCLSTVPVAGLAYTWTIVLASATALISAANNAILSPMAACFSIICITS